MTASISSNSDRLSDFEYGLIISGNAFMKWVVRCMSAAGLTGLGPHDVLVLHAVNHRARGRKLSDICMVLNIDDRHVVSYSLKKLTQRGLVTVNQEGRERYYASTGAGDAACQRYRQIREECVVKSLSWLDENDNAISTAASFLRTMTALYDQAERIATVSQTSPKATDPPADAVPPVARKQQPAKDS